MKRKNSSLTPFDLAIVLAGLLVVAGLQVAFAPDGTAALVRKAPPSPEEAFTTWNETATGYAAFARGEKGAYGWVTSRNTRAAAEADALSFCGQACRIIATKDEVIHAPELDVPVSTYTHDFFLEYLEKPAPKAFAITDGGTVGYVYNKVAPHAAALETCREYARLRDPGLPDYPCRVVHSVF